ncbi:MAG: GTPase Era [Deltaproteobacteria bacterium]|nr:GTPase Era [Deltaproteobacteria bacterium]MCB9788131.1 GTPase Era [Deltaproteobacteria bacterium]
MTEPDDTTAPTDAAPAPDGDPHRAGFVALVGRPNVGKSTLLNQLVGERVAITTPKPQTTRDRIRGIRTFDDWQVVYVDTPGIHEASTLLNRYMVELAIGTLGDADLVYLLVDGAHLVAKPEAVLAETADVVGRVAAAGTPCVLIVNKVDKVPDKGQLLPHLAALGELHPFIAVVPLSARTGDGVDRLHALTRPRLPESPPLFPEDSLTDRSMRFLAAEMIREQLFHRLSQELPYQVAVTTDAWEEREDGLVVVYATVHVARDGHKGIIIGKGGERLKAVGRAARLALERFSERRIFLDLRVRVEERWNERAIGLKKLGYDES